MWKMVLALLLSFHGAYAADEAQAITPEQSLMQTVILIGVVFSLFYFILWRPEQKRRKAMESLRNALKEGDKVTAVGIIGTVHKILDDTVIITMVDGSKIEVLKGVITEVIPPKV